MQISDVERIFFDVFTLISRYDRESKCDSLGVRNDCEFPSNTLQTCSFNLPFLFALSLVLNSLKSIKVSSRCSLLKQQQQHKTTHYAYTQYSVSFIFFIFFYVLTNL